MKKIKTAVIGVGYLGEKHAGIYHKLPDTELVGVVDIDLKRAKKIAGLYRTAYADKLTNLSSKQPEAVSIAVPTDRHFAVASNVIKKNIHVLLEKPITPTLKEAEILLKLSHSRNIIFQIGHIERYNNVVKELTKIIDSPRFIECHRLGPYQPRGTEVGVVLDLMIHDLDVILNLVNSEITRIDAVGVSVLSNYEDIANVRIIFKNNCVANITASRISPERLRKIRIFQKNAYISVDYMQQEMDIYLKTKNKIIKKEKMITKQPPLKTEIIEFINCIRHKKEPLTNAKKSKEALELALKISRKIDKKK
jgi:predicted dehydrogenase